ncbi:energy-coupled thiamine transporter ThiT [Kurthia sibirica]|uniref:Energy-coupled thiamine transporter ThiT n=1 Tax=Kurthia sibirica TaxID=202750 RepID=A0A2U3AL87_9BACL|nr:energy-coupled thiamine transporter ThiT [Kurthia sibirica]PWI25281.1 energy-coupled thiamine transporter ThiT [Kurthia sibirica]GEK34662.1 thiamine transporter ThiT [Kurthia sibirica]
MNHKRLVMMIEIAVFAAIAVLLDNLVLFKMPQGGSVSLAMLPIVLMALRWGTLQGMITGFLVGLLQIAFGPTIFSPLQGFIDYFLAFTVVGLAGVVRGRVISASVKKSSSKMLMWILVGTALGGVLRFIAHTAAGVAFFSAYAGEQNVYVYSIVYNGSYMLPAIILTTIVIYLLFKAAPKLFVTK